MSDRANIVDDEAMLDRVCAHTAELAEHIRAGRLNTAQLRKIFACLTDAVHDDYAALRFAVDLSELPETNEQGDVA